MKGAVLALFCSAALVGAEINENGCPINPFIDVLKPHPNCNKFYQCMQGELLERSCASNLVFNVKTQECDYAENVDCENKPVAPDSSEEAGDTGNGSGNYDPSLGPEICAKENSDGILVANKICNKFYECHNGVPVVHRCASTLLWNPSTGLCDWPENVDCGERKPGGDADSGNGDGNGENGNDNSDSDSGNSSGEEAGNGDSGHGDNDNGSNGGGGNSDPSEASKICATEGSDGILVAHEICNQFYKCSEGIPFVLDCPPNLLFNPNNDQCDWPENVSCDGRDPDGGNSDGGNGDGENGDGGNGDNGNNVGGGNGNPAEAPQICAAEGSDGVLVAHENCNQFYMCSEGNPVALSCPPYLLFNPNNDQCDWPKNVNCDGRNPDGGNGDNGVGDNGDGSNGGGDNGNVGGGNDNPSDAPEICATEGSDGVLVAHENCNQFYKCAEGKPVALNCPLNLLYNPSTEQCDWPENVNCDGRNKDSENVDVEDSGKEEENENDGAGNDNPKEAPGICAVEGSDGVLVAHENCNQFYLCSEGLPVTLDCPLNLLFNPSNNQCDWPENVNCERTPESENGDGDSENGGDAGSGGGNNNPADAPKICGSEGSEGVLVAHENCNQFYICSEGLPVVRECPLNLFFNPTNDQCDWAVNVECGRRNTFTSFNKHMRFRI